MQVWGFCFQNYPKTPVLRDLQVISFTILQLQVYKRPCFSNPDNKNFCVYAFYATEGLHLKKTTATQKFKRTEFTASEIFMYLYLRSVIQSLQNEILFLEQAATLLLSQMQFMSDGSGSHFVFINCNDTDQSVIL